MINATLFKNIIDFTMPSALLIKHFLRYFLPAILAVVALAFLGMQQAQQTQLNALKMDANKKVLAAKALAIDSLNLTVRDINYISNSELLTQVLAASVSNVDHSNPSVLNTSLDALARDWQALMSASPAYEQLRWIDEDGLERLRIDHSDILPIRIAEDQLQDKSDRYYFSKAINLNQDQFYLSPFDLNIENGIIDVPHKPMIRLAKPVVDELGVNRGVVVLNYLGDGMLQRIKQLKSADAQKIWLTNEQGFWLLACFSAYEWGFMYDKPELTVDEYYPEAWQKISAAESGSFTDKMGLWYFDTIRPLKEAAESQLTHLNQVVIDENLTTEATVANAYNHSDYFWKVIYYTPQKDVLSLVRAASTPIYIGLLFVLILVAVGSVFLARARLAKELSQEALEESVERYSGVLRASMDGFVLMDTAGTILEWNQALYDILHLEDLKIEGRLLESLFDGEQRKKVATYISNLFVSGYCQVEVECIRDEVKYYTEISFMPVHATGQICAFMRDITEQKENEFQLKMSASVFTHANEGIILTDANFLIVDVNDEFEFITGYAREEVSGQRPSMLDSNKQSLAFYNEMKQDLLSKAHWYGELWSRRKTGELFLAFLNITQVKHPHEDSYHYVWMFNDITLEKQYQKRLQISAHYDTLTNLPNRFLLNDRLKHAIVEAKRTKRLLAVVFIDLDGFKAVNDTHGHDMGDALLVSVAKHMKAALRATDTVARIGGDEFVVVIGGLHSFDEAIPIVEKLLKAASKPVKKSGHVVQVSGSVGVTFYHEGNNLDGELLMRQADQAMYQAKQSGKNRYHVFDIEEDALNRDLIGNLNRIEYGLLNNEFVLHYQPKVAFLSDEIVGVEALIRWQHPEKGFLYPGDFLSSVENTPLAIKLTEWVVGAVLKQIELWQQQGVNLPVSINVGSMELQKTDFVEWIIGLLDQAPNISRSMIELEVLETSALADVHMVQELIQECKDHGIGFALDDFGTGFASLSYLKRLPIETIKIDQSFIRNMFDDPEDITLLEGLIGLAKMLNRTVVAEGVETESHGVVLIELGCHYGQGYFIAKPMASELVPAWAAKWRRPASWIQQTNVIKELLVKG